jgi:hypothetical protein
MSLKNSRVFRLIGFVLMTLVFVSLALRALLKVTTGHGFDTYLTGKGTVLNYWSALVIVGCAVVAGAVAVGTWGWKRLKGVRGR